jgi:hypothetical protein
MNLAGSGNPSHFNGTVFLGGPPADFTLAVEPGLLVVRKKACQKNMRAVRIVLSFKRRSRTKPST